MHDRANPSLLNTSASEEAKASVRWIRPCSQGSVSHPVQQPPPLKVGCGEVPQTSAHGLYTSPTLFTGSSNANTITADVKLTSLPLILNSKKNKQLQHSQESLQTQNFLEALKSILKNISQLGTPTAWSRPTAPLGRGVGRDLSEGQDSRDRPTSWKSAPCPRLRLPDSTDVECIFQTRPPDDHHSLLPLSVHGSSVTVQGLNTHHQLS